MSSNALFVEPVVVTSPGTLTSTNVGTGLDPAAYNGATAYALDQQVSDGNGIYQSLQAANTGHATSDATWWVRVGSINKMRMFDQKVGSQTERADTIVVEITPGVVVDLVALRNVEGYSVTVEQSTVAEGILYSRTVLLDDAVGDWLEYWYSALTYQTDAVFRDLLPISDSKIKITIDNTGSTAKCGELLMGPALEAGITQSGVQDGIDDYSVIKPDEFGVRDIVERDYADNMDITVVVEAARSPRLRHFLTSNRAKPILLIAADARPDALVYGLAESWRRVLSYPGFDVFNITMKGLT